MRPKVTCPRCRRVLARPSKHAVQLVPEHFCPHRVHCTDRSECVDCIDVTWQDMDPLDHD